jgi:hypothetical protein
VVEGGSQGLQKFIAAAQQIQAKIQGHREATGGFAGRGELTSVVAVVGDGELTGHGGLRADVVAIVESASPKLAGDIRNLSREKFDSAVNALTALGTAAQLVLSVYLALHHQPPQQPQEIFNQTVIVYDQTTNNVINMPQGHG